MDEEIQLYLDDAKEHMLKSVNHVNHELIKIRAGKAMPNMLDGISVEYYGSPTPINQVASVSTPDARTLMVKPWEKTIIPDIERAIINSDLGLNPQNDGEKVIINIPVLTEERRQKLVKSVRQECEHGRVSVRNIRKDVNDSLKKLLKEGFSEDEIRKAEDLVQTMTDDHIKKIDGLMHNKEEEIMTV